jgi:hypothetical protein
MSGPHMPWFKFHSTAPDDEKVHALTGELGDPGADVYLYRLWAYCGRRKPNGRFAKATAVSVIESGAGWKGERGRLVDVLLAVGLLDDLGEEYEVHKWPEYQSALVAKFDADKKRPPGRTRTKGVPPVSRAGFVECPARENSETPRGVSPLSTLSSSSEGVQGEASRDPAAGSLFEQLCAAYKAARGSTYGTNAMGLPVPKDAAALAELLGLAKNDHAEILARWRNGLARKTYPRVAALRELPHAWDHCAAPEDTGPPRGFGRPQQANGYVRADKGEWTEEESNGVF